MVRPRRRQSTSALQVIGPCRHCHKSSPYTFRKSKNKQDHLTSGKGIDTHQVSFSLNLPRCRPAEPHIKPTSGTTTCVIPMLTTANSDLTWTIAPTLQVSPPSPAPTRRKSPTERSAASFTLECRSERAPRSRAVRRPHRRCRQTMLAIAKAIIPGRRRDP